MTSTIRVWLMEKEIGHVSRDLANQLFYNLTANLVKERKPLTDDEGNPVMLEGTRDSWDIDKKTKKMVKRVVPTLEAVVIERTIGIKISPFVAGSVSKRRSDLLAERKEQPVPFDPSSSKLPEVRFTEVIREFNIEEGDMDEVLSQTMGTVINDLAESIVISEKRAEEEARIAAVNDSLVRTGEYQAPKGDTTLYLEGINLDAYYEGCTPQEKQFLHDTLLSGTSTWGDNRTEEEKELARQKEERYQEDLRALKAKYANGLYHGN